MHIYTLQITHFFRAHNFCNNILQQKAKTISEISLKSPNIKLY